MQAWIPALQATAVCLSTLWLLLTLFSRERTPLRWVWALFCASIAMAMARRLIGPDVATWSLLFAIGGCVTCNGYWLVARALFRTGRPFGAPHLAFAGTVALLIVLAQLARAGDGSSPLATAAVGEMLGLLGSTVLMLTLWEGLRGWRTHRGVERGMRVLFVASYGGCVLVVSLGTAMFDPQGTGAWQAGGDPVAAVLILLVSQGLVAWRLRHPLEDLAARADDEKPNVVPSAQAPPAGFRDAEPTAVRAEDRALARTLEQHMRSERPWLRTDLKLGHLAQALDVGEYRISRAIHDVLGHRNVAHYVNRYRLDHARAMLADPDCDGWSTLVVGLESGFGSLGAFHRAFKAAEGCTPGEYRSARPAPDEVAGRQPA